MGGRACVGVGPSHVRPQPEVLEDRRLVQVVHLAHVLDAQAALRHLRSTRGEENNDEYLIRDKG